MKLKNFVQINSGHVTREAIEPREDGTHRLIQGKDVDGYRYTYSVGDLVRFTPNLRKSDILLEPGDILFMARGVRNYAVLLEEIPDNLLAAASFFIIRVVGDGAIPAYVCWYLNQDRVRHYFAQSCGQGVLMPLVRRGVLEDLPVPLPDLETQASIAELDRLTRRERDLLERLAGKREQLVSALCLQKIKDA